MNYSQGQEQQYILASCSRIDSGRFLDIGAYHPRDKSNSRALYECGWSGVLVEPGPQQVKWLLEEYGNDKRVSIVSAAIGPTRALVPMQITDDGTSTSDMDTYEKWKEICHYLGALYVPTIPLTDILHQFGAFDFVSIDAEGESVHIFHQLLLSTEMRPQCICVEHDGRLAECSQLAFSKGYVQTYLNGENAIYFLP